LERLESILSSVSILEALRRDEIGRVARRFVVIKLAEGQTKELGGTLEGARLVVVVTGRVAIDVQTGAGALHSMLEPGDRYGDIALLTGNTHDVTLRATRDTSVALLDKAGLDAILAEYPAVALPLARELSSELNAKNDLLRQLLEVHAEELSVGQLKAAVEERRRALARRGARVKRTGVQALFRRLVVEQGAEPPFWMLAGFIVSMGIARLVVALILKYHLEKQLFALVPGKDPNPMHVHHFNYGLVLIGLSGLAALFPVGRRALRVHLGDIEPGEFLHQVDARAGRR
jgi:CRP-like cAMP-binding protein